MRFKAILGVLAPLAAELPRAATDSEPITPRRRESRPGCPDRSKSHALPTSRPCTALRAQLHGRLPDSLGFGPGRGGSLAEVKVMHTSPAAGGSPSARASMSPWPILR